MKEIYEELSRKEKEDMELYERELQEKKRVKLEEMDAAEELLEVELDKKKSEVEKLSSQDRKLM